VDIGDGDSDSALSSAQVTLLTASILISGTVGYLSRLIRRLGDLSLVRLNIYGLAAFITTVLCCGNGLWFLHCTCRPMGSKSLSNPVSGTLPRYSIARAELCILRCVWLTAIIGRQHTVLFCTIRMVAHCAPPNVHLGKHSSVFLDYCCKEPPYLVHDMNL